MGEWEWDRPADSGSTGGSRCRQGAGRLGDTVSGPAESLADTPTSGRGSERETERRPARGRGQGSGERRRGRRGRGGSGEDC